MKVTVLLLGWCCFALVGDSQAATYQRIPIPDFDPTIFEVEKSHVSDLISEILGVDIIAVSAIAGEASEEILKAVSGAFGKIRSIANERPNFDKAVENIVVDVFSQLAVLQMDESIVRLIEKFPEFEQHLDTIKNDKTVTKQEITAMLEDLVGMTIPDFLENQRKKGKLIVSAIKDTILALKTAAAEEGPEIEADVQSLIDRTLKRIKIAAKPVVELFRPLIGDDIIALLKLEEKLEE